MQLRRLVYINWLMEMGVTEDESGRGTSKMTADELVLLYKRMLSRRRSELLNPQRFGGRGLMQKKAGRFA